MENLVGGYGQVFYIGTVICVTVVLMILVFLLEKTDENEKSMRYYGQKDRQKSNRSTSQSCITKTNSKSSDDTIVGEVKYHKTDQANQTPKFKLR